MAPLTTCCAATSQTCRVVVAGPNTLSVKKYMYIYLYLNVQAWRQKHGNYEKLKMHVITISATRLKTNENIMAMDHLETNA